MLIDISYPFFLRHSALTAAGWSLWRWTAPFVPGTSPLDGKSGAVLCFNFDYRSAHYWRLDFWYLFTFIQHLHLLWCFCFQMSQLKLVLQQTVRLHSDLVTSSTLIFHVSLDDSSTAFITYLHFCCFYFFTSTDKSTTFSAHIQTDTLTGLHLETNISSAFSSLTFMSYSSTNMSTEF